MLSEKEVQHIAKLSRLGLSSKEVKKFRKELSVILDYIEKLKEINVSKVEPTSCSVKIENITREDKKSAKNKAQSAELLELAPEKKNRYIKVKSVF